METRCRKLNFLLLQKKLSQLEQRCSFLFDHLHFFLFYQNKQIYKAALLHWNLHHFKCKIRCGEGDRLVHFSALKLRASEFCDPNTAVKRLIDLNFSRGSISMRISSTFPTPCLPYLFIYVCHVFERRRTRCD